MVLHRLVQGFGGSQLLTYLQGGKSDAQGANPKTLGAKGGFTTQRLRFWGRYIIQLNYKSQVLAPSVFLQP